MISQPTITSRSNERVKALREGLRGKASRPGELVGVEGLTLLHEAVAAKLEVAAVYVRLGEDAGAVRRLLPGAPVHTLAPDVFASAVDTHSPQGFAALIRIPPERTTRVNALRGTSLLLESVQDPGNLGTLLRSAEAFGAEAVLLVGETANPWSPKVIRASAGSVFRMPIVRLTAVEELRQVGVAVYAAVVRQENADDVLTARLREPALLMVGNEGSGLSAEALAVATDKLWIPCATESLNAAVAGSLLLYEAMRQRATGGMA